MKRSWIIFLLVLVYSCGGGKPFEKRVNKIFKGPVFRNITIGDSYNKVLKTEDKNYMQFPDTSLIKYMYHVTDSEEYQWAYIFDDDKVKQIQFDAYLGQESDGAIYTKLIRNKYDKILGKSSIMKGVITWRKDSVCAGLIDESSYSNMGKVRLIIFSSSDTTINKIDPFGILFNE